ncbi:MAG: 5-(carboxyamino)imidazole ribonucleotide synthase [Verrucomicrobiales bacterium]|nr:5-(carboxyamino)imidazole ribonucleotide synthase [Verrucomicrobiales bacterium]
MSVISPLPPGSTVGVLGGGQLGRMLAIASRQMGYRIVSWVGGPDSGPAGVADYVIEEPFDSPAGLAAFLELAQAATVEFENIPRSLLETVAAKIPLMPGAQAVAICQHREREKRFLEENGIPCASFAVVENAVQLRSALASLPERGGILKTAEFGYDGKGQLSVTRLSDPETVWSTFSTPRAVLEERIELAAELSVLVVRDGSGHALAYDPAENFHRDHILDVSIVPARLDSKLLDQARAIALQVAEALDYRGLLAVEFFLSGDGRLLVNEMAPRPHNSGHHTIDACETSQFEQQLRVLCGLAPGSTRLLCPTVMLNLLGDVWEDANGKPDWAAVLATPGAHLHLYGKHEARRGRKMGHITFTAPTLEEALANQTKAREVLGIPELR